ncbi:MAG: hypothetical protein ABL908_11355, partial [Hyphomicrobium sp.]
MLDLSRGCFDDASSPPDGTAAIRQMTKTPNKSAEQPSSRVHPHASARAVAEFGYTSDATMAR